jgi:hypothetical protein
MKNYWYLFLVPVTIGLTAFHCCIAFLVLQH